MKIVDLSNYALEDLLSVDDLFLDYFNNFLKNPAFPVQLQYNRYFGVFEEVHTTAPSNKLVYTDRLPKHFTSDASKFLGAESSNEKVSTHETSSNQIDLNEVEQTQLFEWVKTERLPLFFRTDSFRDFKLCKLLTRSLNDDSNMNDLDSATSSQLIGGYSRQSPPLSNTLSTDDAPTQTAASCSTAFNRNKINTSNEIDDESNLIDSQPLLDESELEKLNRMLMQRPGSRALSVPAYFPLATLNRYENSFLLKSPAPNVDSSQFQRVKSSKVHEKGTSASRSSHLKRLDNFQDLSKVGQDGETNVIQITKTIGRNLKQIDRLSNQIDGKVVNDLNASFYVIEDEQGNYQTPYDDDFTAVKEVDEGDQELDSEIDDDGNTRVNKNLLIKFDQNNDDVIEENDEDMIDLNIHASINQYKSKFLGSVKGLNEFKEFLKGTNGYRLIKFWLDCEFYHDSMQDYDQIENMPTRNRLFRDIMEKYVFPFWKKMNEKINKSYTNSEYRLNHNLFDKIQYDVLRRLRAYWVPRFIINKLKQRGKDYGSYPLPPITPDYSRQSTYLTVSTASKITPSSGHTLHDGIELNDQQKTTLYQKAKQALLADKESGGPFLRYISTNCADKLPLILFWYDVCDFNNNQLNVHNEGSGYDKASKLEHAKAIYNSYLSPTARFNISVPLQISDEAGRSLETQTRMSLSSVSSSDLDSRLFQPVMDLIVPYLQDAWLDFIKEDLMSYTRARLNVLNLVVDQADELDADKSKLNLPQPEIQIENNHVYVKRPWLNEIFTNRSRQEMDSLQKKVELNDQQREERRERARQMEIERKKALKAAINRAKALKKKKLSTVDEELSRIDQKSNETEKRGGRRGASFQTDRSAFFDKIFANKFMMQMFRKYLVDNGQRDILNRFNAYYDSKQYLDATDKQKKLNIANSIFKNYLDANSKKSLFPLNERLQHKLNADMHQPNGAPDRNARPKSGFMSTVMKEYKNQLEVEYHKFCQQLAFENNLNSAEEFAMLNQTQLLVLLGDNYNPKNFDFDEDKGEGKMMPSKEDRAEFQKMLYEWSIGRYSDKFYAFYAHLSEHGKKDGLPFLEKDLLFCIDSIRLREINGEDVLKQKAQIMIDLFLEAQTNTGGGQLDVTHDLQQKLFRAATKIVQGTHAHNDLQMFDDTRVQFLKDLTPYWAGFKYNLSKNGADGAAAGTMDSAYPLTKAEKLIRERLEEFMQMKNPSVSDFKLPSLNSPLPTGSPTPGPGKKQNLNICFSIASGIKYRDSNSFQQQFNSQSFLTNSTTNNTGNTNSNSNRRNSVHAK